MKALLVIVSLGVITFGCITEQPLSNTADLLRNRTVYESYYMVECLVDGKVQQLIYSAEQQYDYIEELHLCESLTED